jgi:hypothetical protein
MILSTSCSPFASGRPRLRLRLPSGDQVFIRLGHLLSFMRTTCPHHFNTIFCNLSKLFVLPHSLLSLLHFFFLVVWRSLQLFSKNPLHCNPLSKFRNCNLLSLNTVFFYLYLPQYIYSKLGCLAVVCVTPVSNTSTIPKNDGKGRNT